VNTNSLNTNSSRGIQLYHQYNGYVGYVAVVERRSLTGEFSLFHARPVADEWPLVGKTSTIAFHPIGVDKLSSKLIQMCANLLGRRHLVNTYKMNAGWLIPFVDKRVGGR